MSLSRLEIRNGELLLDDALVGALATNPPEGGSASTETVTEEGVVSLKIRWTIGKSLDLLLPLEILRLWLGEFYPRAAFIAGRRYELSRAERARGKKLGFPYNTYYKFRMNARHPYDAALYSKMPVACWEEKHRAFAVAFPKAVTLPQGDWPVFIKATGAEAVVDFSAALLGEFQVQRKPFGWFGTRVHRTEHALRLSEGQSFEATFLLVAADAWVECVRALAGHLHAAPQDAGEVPAESVAKMLDGAVRFYDRVWDGHNRTHVHLPIKNVPRFESVEFKHSHVTDDLTKLVLYRRLTQMGCVKMTPRERELLSKLAGGTYCRERDGSRVWHTTTFFDGTGLEAFTHHGIGFVGFPGGMATVVRRLFEYCSLDRNDALENLAQSGADWLLRMQGEDGSWPASVGEAKGGIHTGCVASTAEAVRALTAAYLRTENKEYRAAVDAGMRFVNRGESFFECRQYLRDVDPDEADGISAEACIHANLDLHDLGRDRRLIEQAEKWGFYALQWIRPRSAERRAEPSFDGLSRSITPRIDVWGGLLIARAFLRLSQTTGEDTWRAYAWRLFENIASLQERDGGLCETWFLDFPSGLESIHIMPTFVTDAFVEFILDACRGDGGNALENALARRNNPPLEPTRAAQGLVEISEARPEFVIDRGLRLALAFDGAYDFFSGAVQAVYTMLREISPCRPALKLAPIAKILLNRHRLSPPLSRIGGTAFIEVMDSAVEKSRGGRRTHRYRTPFHDIVLSVVSEGADPNGLPAADIELDVRTLVGDVRTGQVRIDLLGNYGIRSVLGKDEFVVSSAGNEYSFEITDGSIDSIIRDGDRLALDVSLSANWNFFGRYSLGLRVARRAKERH